MSRLVEDGRARHGTWRCLHLVGDLLNWTTRRRCALGDLDERTVEQHLRHQAGKQSIQPGDRSALKRWVSVLREEGAIASVDCTNDWMQRQRHNESIEAVTNKDHLERSRQRID